MDAGQTKLTNSVVVNEANQMEIVMMVREKYVYADWPLIASL